MNRAIMLHHLSIIPLFALILVETCYGQCGKEQYKECVMLADPLLKESRLIYPDNLKDIIHVCERWGRFVECVKKYTDTCFTENKRIEFNKAVESPVGLVNQMCTSSEYQNEYLKHAPCMRATLTDDSHCGRHYRHLVSQVSGEPATPALCCSHFRFRECLLDQTRRSCDKDAYPFAKQILDKAMGFLQDQCSTYKPEQADCPGAEFYTSTANRATPTWNDLSTAGRMSPDSRIDHWPDDHSQYDGRTTMRKIEFMTQTRTAPSFENPSLPVDNTVDNSRTPYSRGMSWNPSTDSVSPWRVSGSANTEPSWTHNVRSTTVSNLLIDEPNQQGLSNQNSSPTLTKHNSHLLFYITISIMFYVCL